MARDKTQTSTPRKKRWYHQYADAFRMTREVDPSVTWVLLAIFVGVVAVGVIVGLLLDHPVYFTILAVPFALMATMLVFGRKVEAAAYARIEGQAGAALAALRTLRRGWTFLEQPVAVDPRTQDMVFRGVGRPGVVLVGEGPHGRVTKLLEAERKRTARVISGAPVIVIECGNDEGQVPLRKLPTKVRRLKQQLTKAEVAEISKRLAALGAVKLPVPKGVDPLRARPDRKGIRGR